MSFRPSHLAAVTTALALASACAQPAVAADAQADARGSVSASVGPLGLSFGVLELAGSVGVAYGF